MEDPPRKFFRLGPGREVRLRYGYWITCNEVLKDATGRIVELRCSHDALTRGGDNPPPDADGKVRKVKGTLHWVSADHALQAEVRQYDHLFEAENPADVQEGENWRTNLNEQSLTTTTALVEPSLADARPGEVFQFERTGYFSVDATTTAEQPVFNRTVGLKDSWARQQQKR